MSQPMAHFQAANQAMIVFTAESLGTAPRFTRDESNRRRELAINLIMAFLPTEPVQTMFASLVTGNFMSIMDGFRETNSATSNPAQSGRARMVSVAQTRALVGLVHELRGARKEALAAAEADWAARQPVAKPEVAPGVAEAEAEPMPRPDPPPAAETEMAAEPPPAVVAADADDATLLALAAELQAAFADTLETMAEACAANPEGAEQLRPGLARSIPAALAELNQLPVAVPTPSPPRLGGRGRG